MVIQILIWKTHFHSLKNAIKLWNWGNKQIKVQHQFTYGSTRPAVVLPSHHSELTTTLHALGHRVWANQHGLLLSQVYINDALVGVEVQLKGRLTLGGLVYGPDECLQPLLLFFYGSGVRTGFLFHAFIFVYWCHMFTYTIFPLKVVAVYGITGIILHSHSFEIA